MKRILLSLFIITLSATAFAQSYAEKAAAIQKEVWGTKVPEFGATTVPANLSNESAVILARAYNLQKTSTGKFKFMILTAASTTKTVKMSTFHERVKINDKAALEDFSTLEYQKKLDNSVSMLTARFRNTKDTYIGAKIIKADGKEIIVNTGEEVLLKNEAKDQKGKLAISNLQVGDILDYYISIAQTDETGLQDNFADNDQLFVLAGEYPVLYYSLDFQFNKKTIVKYISANGAPKFEESTNGDKDIIYKLVTRNLPKYQTQLWTSVYRQYPYIEISSSYTSGMNKFMLGGESKEERLEANKSLFFSSFNEVTNPTFEEPVKRLKKYFDGSKNIKAAPLDSTMKVLYTMWKSTVFGHFSADDAADVTDINFRKAKSTFAAARMSMALTDMKVDHDVLIVTSRNSNTLENVFNYGDFDALIRINGTKPLYMCFDDVTTQFNEIPARFQGEEALAYKTKRDSKIKYDYIYLSKVKLPVSPAASNVVAEDLRVTLLANNPQKLKVERLVKQTGSIQHNGQMWLIPAGDVDNILMELSKSEPLADRLAKYPETKKKRDAFTYAFANDRQQQVKKFTEEIKKQYDQEPQQVTDTKIINTGLYSNKPVFEYSAAFVLDNLVKKSGNNLIIDAGKLAGTFLKLEEKDRVRTLDVYMPLARTYIYNINIAIPKGYAAKGLDEFNKQLSNSTGNFTCTAKLNGDNVNISVSRVYSSNFEKAAAWPQLTQLVDAAAQFNTQKILFEKL